MTLTWHVNIQTVQLYEMYKYAYKNEVSNPNDSKAMANAKNRCLFIKFDLWPWKMTLTLKFYHSKCEALWDA